MSKHTPGPWKKGSIEEHELSWRGIRRTIPIYDPSHTQPKWARKTSKCGTNCKVEGYLHPVIAEVWWHPDESDANARLIAAAPEMLEELKLANKIIINALNVMTSEQKLAWDKLNTRDDLKNGLAVTRNHARESVIAKAESRS